jgi:hypothetical protein
MTERPEALPGGALSGLTGRCSTEIPSPRVVMAAHPGSSSAADGVVGQIVINNTLSVVPVNPAIVTACNASGFCPRPPEVCIPWRPALHPGSAGGRRSKGMLLPGALGSCALPLNYVKCHHLRHKSGKVRSHPVPESKN